MTDPARRRTRALLLPLPLIMGALLTGGASSTSAQDAASGCDDVSALPSSLSEYARVLEVAGEGPAEARLIRRGGTACAEGGPWNLLRAQGPGDGGLHFGLTPVRMELLGNTGYPRDINNGAAWAGRGLNSTWTAGFRAAWGPLLARVQPVVAYQRNAAFETAPVRFQDRTDFAYPWGRRIDWPQRMGAEPFWTVHRGQSTIRLDAWAAAAGVSTENLWWGPGIRSSLLMGASAPGFPHVFLGTSGPVNVWLGDLEVEAVWGRLRESEYFDDDPTNDRRLFTGIVGSFEPRWLPGLHLGGSRVFYQPLLEEGLPLYEYFRFFEGFSPDMLRERYGSTQDRTDQLIGLYARWVLPESGFETYAEWGRNDRSAHFDDFIQEPDHSQAYLLGFQKVVKGETRWVRLGGELIHLDKSITRLDRVTVPWYTHHEALQGYTNGGQLLGAWIGPGSQSQYLAADVFQEWGSVGLYTERVRYNSDEYYQSQSRWLDGPGSSARPLSTRACECRGWVHDVELTTGLRGSAFWRSLVLDAELAYSHRRHRNYDEDDQNVLVRLGVSWRPDLED